MSSNRKHRLWSSVGEKEVIAASNKERKTFHFFYHSVKRKKKKKRQLSHFLITFHRHWSKDGLDSMHHIYLSDSLLYALNNFILVLESSMSWGETIWVMKYPSSWHRRRWTQCGSSCSRRAITEYAVESTEFLLRSFRVTIKFGY